MGTLLRVCHHRWSDPGRKWPLSTHASEDDDSCKDRWEMGRGLGEGIDNIRGN